jgi:hypothetical protein
MTIVLQMTLTLLSLAAGLVLGQYFKVAVLIPATGLFLAIAIGSGMVHSYPLWGTALLTVAGGAALQVGFLVGAVIRTLRADRSPASFPASHPRRAASSHLHVPS